MHGERKFIKSVGEESQVVKRGGEYHCFWEEYYVEKRERGSNIIFPIILGLLGRISSDKEGKRTEFFLEENEDLKQMFVGKKSKF